MYALYKKNKSKIKTEYQFQKSTHLFGYKSGYIHYFLKEKVDKNASEPIKWAINIESCFKRDDQENSTLIINLKPNNSKPNLSLYEIVNVWGVSSRGWTPIMMHLNSLFVDENPADHNENNFHKFNKDINQPIFSYLYLKGTLQNGDLKGKWTAPSVSPTNSALLWPDTFQYFTKIGNEIINKYES